LAGQPFTHVVAPEYIESTIERFKKGIRGQDTPPYEAELLHKNGERIPVEFLVTTQYDGAGRATGRFGIGRDITERRKVEKTLRDQREQLRTLSAQLSEAEEGERRRIARELHDQVGQSLTVVGINLNVLRSLLPAEGMNPTPVRLLEDSVALVEQTTEYTRSLMSDLRPPDMDDYGLVAAIRWYSERFSLRTGVEVIMEAEEIHPRPAAAIENNLFRIVQEVLTNISKHARAGTVRIDIDGTEGRLRLRIMDDGVGFDPSRLKKAGEHHGWGLMTMAERAEVIGGRFSLESRTGRGTIVSVEVPL
jgi:signal transduction histidine kinase